MTERDFVELTILRQVMQMPRATREDLRIRYMTYVRGLRAVNVQGSWRP